MINIDNIINAPIIKIPWDHKEIDNFFDTETYDKIKEVTQLLAARKFTNELETSVDIFEYPSILNTIQKTITELELQTDTILGSFENKRQYNKYHWESRFNVTHPKKNSKLHDEWDRKILSLIVYIEPEESLGTRLYTKKENGTFKMIKQIEWKPNKAFLMCGLDSTTWHSVTSGNHQRVTINYFIIKDDV